MGTVFWAAFWCQKREAQQLGLTLMALILVPENGPRIGAHIDLGNPRIVHRILHRNLYAVTDEMAHFRKDASASIAQVAHPAHSHQIYPLNIPRPPCNFPQRLLACWWGSEKNNQWRSCQKRMHGAIVSGNVCKPYYVGNINTLCGPNSCMYVVAM